MGLKWDCLNGHCSTIDARPQVVGFQTQCRLNTPNQLSCGANYVTEEHKLPFRDSLVTCEAASAMCGLGDFMRLAGAGLFLGSQTEQDLDRLVSPTRMFYEAPSPLRGERPDRVRM